MKNKQEANCVMALRGILVKIYNKMYSICVVKTAKVCDVSIGDILLQRGDVDSLQFITSSRYLDIKSYCTTCDDKFYYQNIISRIAYGDKHHEKEGNIAFKYLIESYKRDGYNSHSNPILDKNLRLIDGTHRTAANLFFCISKIRVRVVKGNAKASKNTDWYYNMLLPSDAISEVMEEFENIQKKLILTGNTFCCVVESLEERRIKEILNDLKFLVTVLGFSSGHSKTYEGGVGTKFIIQFSLTEPRYRYKDGIMVSLRCAEIEAILNKRYPDVRISVSKNCLDGKNMFDGINIEQSF